MGNALELSITGGDSFNARSLRYESLSTGAGGNNSNRFTAGQPDREPGINRKERIWISDPDWHQVQRASDRLLGVFSCGSGWRAATFVVPDNAMQDKDDDDIRGSELMSVCLPSSRPLHNRVDGYRLRRLKNFGYQSAAGSMPARIPDPAGASALSFAKLQGPLEPILRAYVLLDGEAWKTVKWFAIRVFTNPATDFYSIAIDHAFARLIDRQLSIDAQAASLGCPRAGYRKDVRRAEEILTKWLIRASKRFNRHANAYLQKTNSRDVANTPERSGPRWKEAMRASRRYRSFWLADETTKVIEGKSRKVIKTDAPVLVLDGKSPAAIDALTPKYRHGVSGLYSKTTLQEFVELRAWQRELEKPKGSRRDRRALADVKQERKDNRAYTDASEERAGARKNRPSSRILQKFREARDELDDAEAMKLRLLAGKDRRRLVSRECAKE